MDVRRLGEVCQDIFLGINTARRPPGQNGALAPIVQVKHISDDGFLVARDQLTEGLTVEPRDERYLLRLGDVLLTARGSIGRCTIVAHEHAGTLASSNLIVLRPDILLRAELILAFLRHPRTQAAMRALTAGSAMPTLNVRNISQLSVEVPPQRTQAALAQLIALGETQYTAALEAAKLRREIALDMAMRKLAPPQTNDPR